MRDNHHGGSSAKVFVLPPQETEQVLTKLNSFETGLVIERIKHLEKVVSHLCFVIMKQNDKVESTHEMMTQVAAINEELIYQLSLISGVSGDGNGNVDDDGNNFLEGDQDQDQDASVEHGDVVSVIKHNPTDKKLLN